MKRILIAIALCLCTAPLSFAQQRSGSIKGQVLDELGGAIVGVTVTAIDAKGVEKTVQTNDGGSYTINGLAPGRYTVRAVNPGFGIYENAEVDVIAAKPTDLNVTLKVAIEEQKVIIAADTNAVNTEPENNQGALIIKGDQIDSLPDDPDDLAAALQALAGPSAGPNGGQIFIDGFTGGRLPPRASIREIRINSNPFSAEYDRLGLGRIEILTKPGTDRYRGQASFNFNDDALNSRNPFAPNRPSHQSRQYGGNFGGPISKKKASFFVDFEKRDIDDAAVVNALILDSNNNVTPFDTTVPTPSRRTSFSPRVDFQINSNNTLVARYSYTHTTNLAGVGQFSLPSRAYDVANTEQQINLTETAVINKTIVNETRFQFEHQIRHQNGDNTLPTIQVTDAFISGGSQVGQQTNTNNSWELTNNTSFTKGAHALKVGARMRHVSIDDFSPQNFGGTYTFDSLTAYQLTVEGLLQGASQFTIAGGNPQSSVSQFDFGGYGQDDWKLRPNLTLSLGLRYENQSNISSNLNFAPRVGFAWSPFGGPSPKTVIRGGFGVFYDRVGESLTLNASRLNGENQKQFIVRNPTFYPTIPSIATLEAFQVPLSIYQLADNIQAPYTTQAVASVEHQLPHNLTVALSYINVRTLHTLRTRPVNAPLPISGIRPMGVNENIFQYESSGRYNQNQFIVNVNNRISRNASLNAYYVFAKAKSDADGTGSFPSNPYDLAVDYGRASGDIRHRFVLTGNFRTYWGVSLAPFVIVQSGRPFNITIGRDINLDTVFTDRPAIATDLSRPSVIVTKYGAFDLNPLPGATIIPRNGFEGPGSTTVNLRISKTFGFGSEGGSSAQNNNGRQGNGTDANNQQGQQQRNNTMMGGMGGRGGGGGAPRGGGGGGGFGGPGGGGFGGFGGGGNAGSRYSLTFSLNFNNIFNHANLGNPVGNLSSRLFGQSTSTAGGFGGFGAIPAYNRRIDAQVRFNF
ncbi:MAG TPA: TonB-dependent receptor [Pyrinomonadaceae bacterium]